MNLPILFVSTNRKKCVQFYDYLENTLGPVINSFQHRFSVEEININPA